jgi:hypothetical protein
MADEAKHLASLEEAAALAGRRFGIQITAADFHRLIDLGLVPSLRIDEKALVFSEHALAFGAIAGTILDVSGQLELSSLPSGDDVLGHVLLRLAPSLAVSFNPAEISVLSLQLFIRALREGGFGRQASLLTLQPHVLQRGLCVWSTRGTHVDLRGVWAAASSEDSYVQTAEAMCVPSLYGNKARLLPFIVGAILQNSTKGSSFCDLMTGTGLVGRHMLTHYPVLANDASPFSAVLAKSQAIDLDEETARALGDTLATYCEQHLAELSGLLAPALAKEESFLMGGLSPGRLDAYRQFAGTFTRFIPGQEIEIVGDAELSSLSQRLTSMVKSRRADPSSRPFLLATSYWSNCYFGVRQAVELDSLAYAISHVSGAHAPLLKALMLTAAEACMSGPHFAQPPRMSTEKATRSILEKRSRSIWSDFKLRLSLVAKRRKSTRKEFEVTCLPWREAIVEFDRFAPGQQGRVVYADPPYSRLQYSRYYHVFDTLLRYDYPACVGSGRTSEREKRFTSPFDSRQTTATKEFEELFARASELNATLCVSYSTEGTVPVESLLDAANRHFRKVAIYSAPVRHHSQGRVLENRGHRIEVLIVCKR